MMIVWGIARMLALRGAAKLLGAWLDPLGRLVILAALGFAVVIGARAYWIGQGRQAERAENAAVVREAEVVADGERNALMAALGEAQRRDAAELARIEAEERAVREEAARRTAEAAAKAGAKPPAEVMWSADDHWLKAKRR